MGLSGFVGSGVQDALSQQLMEQLRVAALAEEQRQALEREAMASREQARREAEDADQRTQADFLRKRLTNQDAQAANVLRDAQLEKQTLANQRNDAALVQQMPGMSPEQKNAELAGIGTRAGEIGLIDLMKINTPAPKKMRAVTVRGPNGEPINRMVPEDEAVQEYREPPKAQTGPTEQEWVIRGGRPVPITKGTAQVGDLPYDKSGGGSAGAKADKQQSYALDSANAIVAKVDALAPRIGVMTAGPIGEVLRHAPGTPAANVAADLESLASNLAFNELTKMRAASPTGGALGNVSDKETALLTSVVASIRQNQSPDNLRRNLAAIKASAERIKKAAEIDAGLGGMTPSPGHGTEADQGGGVAGLSYADYLRRRK